MYNEHVYKDEHVYKYEHVNMSTYKTIKFKTANLEQDQTIQDLSVLVSNRLNLPDQFIAQHIVI